MLTDLLVNVLQKRYSEKQRKRNESSKVIHVSDIVADNFCLRKVVLCAEKGLDWREKSYFDSGILMTFWIGEKIEEIVRECFGKYVDEQSFFQVKVGPFTIQGSADIILKLKRKRVILEVKSISRDKFNFLEKPLPQHEFQLGSYLYLATEFFGKEKPPYQKSGYIIYVAKEYVPLPIKVFRVSLSDHVRRFYNKFFMELRAYVKGYRYPSLCSEKYRDRCRFLSLCMEGGDAQV